MSTYESKYPNLQSMVERYVGARVEADIELSLGIEQEINTYLAANSSPEAYDEQQHMQGLFAGVVLNCDTQLGPLGALDLYVLDPVQL